ncbi:MAG: hypothetical protein ABSH53_07520 [Holophaga sp.]|jgi:hypothetical protein
MASLGPFSVNAGPGEEPTGSEKSQFTREGEIDIPYPQIIAIVGTVMPPCPPKAVRK